MTNMQPSPDRTFLRQGIHLDVKPRNGFYTGGDKIVGVVHCDPIWGTKSVTEVNISLYGDANGDWDPDGDSSESRTGILEMNLNIYRGDAVEKKNFPFEFKFPSHTTQTTPCHTWYPNDQFEHKYGHPLPRTWECHFSRIRYTLNAYVTMSTGKVIHFSKKVQYRPSLETTLDDIPWREHVYILSGFFRSGSLMPEDAIESYPIESKLVKFRFPTTLVAGEPFRGSIHIQLPHSVESLKLWHLVIEAKFTNGYRILNPQDRITTRPCYHMVRLLSVYASAITLSKDQPLDLQSIAKRPVPPFYTLRTFNIRVSCHVRIRAIFSDTTGKVYRLSTSGLSMQIVGSPQSCDA